MAKTKEKPATKSETYQALADATELKRKDVAGVFDSLGTFIKKELSKKGMFTIPGLCKIIVVHKPASKGGTRPNPFAPGEMMTVKPKPARKIIKVRALKNLKDMV